MKTYSDRVKKYLGSLRHRRTVRFCVASGVVVIVFALGIAVGDGRIGVDLSVRAQSENSGLPASLNYASVDQVYRALKENYNGKLTATQLLDGLKEGLAQATNDPYTEYFNAQDADTFADELNNSFSGIGAALGKNDAGDLIIVSPIKGFPADKAGLLPQDVIAAINGQDTVGIAPDIAAGKIRGPKDTTVTLKIIRNKTDTFSVTITRADIHLPSVTSKIIDGNIGYMQISSFSNDTAELARKAAASFTAAHVKGVILDLRGNPGGLLDAAVDVSGLWLPDNKTIVTEKGTNGNQSYTSSGNHPLQGMPTVVLINQGSASASEITAGALHDNDASYLIGTRSFGKGVVQQLVSFGDGSELKVTIASWYRPDGQNINKTGITPDKVVTVSSVDQQANRDPQLQAAETYLNH